MSKLKLVEMVNTKDLNLIEDLDITEKPDYQVTDVTVLPDEDYQPTIQSILISLEESQELHESQSSKLSINTLSETVNEKTGYSNSLFEFESPNGTITLTLALTESDKYPGVFNVSAYTTKGVCVFETNTQKPRLAVKNYLNSLSDEYLIKGSEDSKLINESQDASNLIYNTVTKIKKLKDEIDENRISDLSIISNELENILLSIENDAINL